MIISGKQARKGMWKGIEKISIVVMPTLGNKGRNNLFKNELNNPQVTNDGLTSALKTKLDSDIEKLAGDSIIDIAQQVKKEAGDASTTAITIAAGLAKRAFRAVNFGADPNELKRGMLAASVSVVGLLKNLSTKIKTKEQAHNIATISSEDKEIGRIVSDVVWEVGEHGIVTVEESNSFRTESSVVKGLQFEGGYISPNMVTNQDTLESIMDDAIIIVVDKKLTGADNLFPLINELISEKEKRECVIIANDFDADVMTFLALNRMKQTFSILAIKSSGFGHRKFDMLNDIATVTGATIISKELGIPLEKATHKHFGHARKVISTPFTTTIIDASGNKEAIDARVKSLQEQLKIADNFIEVDFIKKRIAKMTGGIGVIKVGAQTELEMQYLRLKIQDAVRAVQSAMQEGYIAGGGSVLHKIGKALQHIKWFLSDYEKGEDIVYKAIQDPMNQIFKNSKIKEYPYNLIDSGIIDPVKATRSAVEHSVSGIATLITVENVLA